MPGSPVRLVAVTDDEAPAEIMICRVCGRVLDSHTVLGWDHSYVDQPADHEADPVPAGSGVPTKARCDFCSEENPGFIVPAKDFEVMRNHMSRGDWSACEACAGFIEMDRWGQVINRAAARFYAVNGQPMPSRVRTSLSVMYHLLRENLNGPVRPYSGDPAHP